MKRLGVWILLAGLAACQPIQPEVFGIDPEHAPPEGEGETMPNRKGLLNSAPNLVIDDSIVGSERQALQRLIDEAKSVVASSGFRQDMDSLNGQYSRVWLTKDTGYASASMIAAMVAQPVGETHYVKTRVILAGNDRKFSISVDDDRRTSNGSRVLSIGRGHLARYRSSSDIVKSCAINSIAHEITHTLSRSRTVFLYAVRDTGPDNDEGRQGPMASYLVGSVAQCSHLRQSGRIAPEEVARCVQTFGVKPVFLSNNCRRYDPARPSPAAEDAE